MNKKYQINLKLIVRFRKTPTEALKLLQEVYGDDTMSTSRVFEWHKRFQEGRKDVEVDSKSGRPSISRTSENNQPVR